MYGYAKQMQPRFNAHGYSSASPSYMMMYPYCHAENGDPSSFGNFASPIPQPPRCGAAMLPRQSYGYPMSNMLTTQSFGQEEEMDGGFEVHDNYLKAPITVRPSVVYPSVGSQRLFSSQQPACLGTRSAFRVCEPFQEGKCILGEGCNDIHLFQDFLSATRHGMVSWLQGKECEFKNARMHDPQTVFRVFCADLKEVVEVPVYALRFTKGLYVDHGSRARRTRGGYQNQSAAMASQVPTACGLFSVDPAQCKWGRWCNQVHIELNWMKSKRSEFESWSNSLEERFNALAPDYKFTVHDPQLKTSLKLPKVSIAEFSRGLFQGSAKKAPSICMLYQRNRCTANSCCNQIHVMPPYLNLHRRWVSGSGEMSEEEHRNLGYEIGFLCQRLTAQTQRANPLVSATRSSDGDFVEPNPQARAFATTPQQDGGNERAYESLEIQRSASTSHNSRSQCRSNPRQTTSPSVNDRGVSPKRSIAGFVMPLGELVSNLDGEDHSQSSLQASQSNISHAAQSYRHSNNPYAMGASSSCTATPSFGWVQPVRSAGNSVTTVHTANCVGHRNAQNGEYSGSRGAGGKHALSTPVDSRQTCLGYQQHELDRNMHLLPSPVLQFNASTSTNTGSRAEQYRVGNSTPEGGMHHNS